MSLLLVGILLLGLVLMAWLDRLQSLEIEEIRRQGREEAEKMRKWRREEEEKRREEREWERERDLRMERETEWSTRRDKEEREERGGAEGEGVVGFVAASHLANSGGSQGA